MNENKKVIVGLYPRVSTEDQSRFGHSLDEQECIKSLREFYNIKETTIQADLFNINEYDKDNIIQIIPQERKTKFEKNKFTILEIEV